MKNIFRLKIGFNACLRRRVFIFWLILRIFYFFVKSEFLTRVRV